MKPENHPFSALSPDFILDAIESRGFRVDARILELNSYENRVFQIGIENREPIIAKFYRPDRWSQDQVQEEHDFLLELASNELSVVAPISLGNTTQFKAGKFMVALFERRGGRTPNGPRRHVEERVPVSSVRLVVSVVNASQSL